MRIFLLSALAALCFTFPGKVEAVSTCQTPVVQSSAFNLEGLLSQFADCTCYSIEEVRGFYYKGSLTLNKIAPGTYEADLRLKDGGGLLIILTEDLGL